MNFEITDRHSDQVCIKLCICCNIWNQFQTETINKNLIVRNKQTLNNALFECVQASWTVWFKEAGPFERYYSTSKASGFHRILVLIGLWYSYVYLQVKRIKPRLHDRTSCIQLIWNFLFHIPCRATRYNLIYISPKIPVFHLVMQTCWHSLIWVKVKQESVMFSTDAGVVWAGQCFALLKFIIPFVFFISCTLWEMILHNWTNL